MRQCIHHLQKKKEEEIDKVLRFSKKKKILKALRVCLIWRRRYRRVVDVFSLFVFLQKDFHTLHD